MDRGFGEFGALVPRRPLPIGGLPPAVARPLLVALALGLGFAAVRAEVRTSRLQAFAAARLGSALDFPVLGGRDPAPPAAAQGPYDRRLGYDRIPASVARLEAAGFRVTAQARPSPRAEALASLGLPAIYPEKSRAGLRVEDRSGAALTESRYPRRAFGAFEEVPRLARDTLLFIENRKLLAPGFPHRSPVIEWERFAHAALLQALPRGRGRRPGASTLAIQIEKYRHSPGGVTVSIAEKLRQIGAATLRAYHAGPDTTAARRRIVADYVNTVPLAARPGFGEVNGIPDGLWAWFGADLRETARALEDGPPAARALAYRRVLSLVLAQRRPSHYLRDGRGDLHALVDAHLPLLAEAGVIEPALRDAALATRPGFVPRAPREPRAPFAGRKAAHGVRADLLGWLGVAGAYDLDRMDLAVTTTLDGPAQARVSAILRELGDPDGRGATLRDPALLGPGDPRQVVYSFLLFERDGDANVVRVQADTLDQPFDVNDGLKLDLGSTAKLRTLVHYLELVAGLYDRHAGPPRDELAALEPHPRDSLTRFVLERLRAEPAMALETLVEAALDRSFSAAPGRFYTGGGSHRFGNYEDTFDDAHVSLRTALRHSVNLPFVRLMREIVDHLSFRPGGPGGNVLADREDPRRAELLSRFAEREGLAFLSGFVDRHRGRSPLEREALLVERAERSRPDAWRLSVLYRSLHPEGDVAALHRFLARHRPAARFHGDDLRRWHAQASPWRLTLADRGWLTGLHPLEIWLVGYWNANLDAEPGEIRVASEPVRSAAYAWLFRAGRRAQDLRIRAELERNAFAEVHAAWQRTGYPFASLVPSLATAIGSSADRPASLAELMGILQNDGLRLPSRRIDAIALAEATPYETRLRARGGRPDRVVRPEVARALRAALVDVVENGTARRARGSFRAADGSARVLGAKTGTGDARRKRFGRDGALLASEVSSRSATLAFLVGDRHFGVLTAYVEGEAAGSHAFTSSLPAHVLRVLAPSLEPLVEAPAPGRMHALRPAGRAEPAVLATSSAAGAGAS